MSPAVDVVWAGRIDATWSGELAAIDGSSKENVVKKSMAARRVASEDC